MSSLLFRVKFKGECVNKCQHYPYINLNIEWSEPNVSYPNSLFVKQGRHVKNRRMTCAANGETGKLRIDAIQAEIKNSSDLWAYLCFTFSIHLTTKSVRIFYLHISTYICTVYSILNRSPETVQYMQHWACIPTNLPDSKFSWKLGVS